MKSARNWGRLGMKFETTTFRFEDLTLNFDKQRIPLSSGQREKRQGQYRYYGAQGVIDYVDDYIFDGKYLLIAEDGENLKSKKQDIAQIVKGKFWVNNHAHVVQGNALCLTEYLCYLLNHNDLSGYITGSAQPKLSQANLNAIAFDVPSIETQQIIVSIISALDEKIAINRAINDNLEQQAQLLFKSWFVDFEPFNGTMPSDWEVVPFETIVDFQNGYAFKSKELLNEPSSDCYQVFKQGHIARGGGFIPDGTKSWYPKKLASKLEKFVLKKGDILMAMTDMKDNVAILGNTAIMPIENEYIVNQRVGHLRANGYKGITYPFIYLLTNSTDFLIDLRSRANSGVQVNLSSSEIKASQTVLPSEKVNTAFSEITLPMFEAIISNQLENQRLAQLRDTLLPKLMSGKLDVSDIEL